LDELIFLKTEDKLYNELLDYCEAGSAASTIGWSVGHLLQSTTLPLH